MTTERADHDAGQWSGRPFGGSVLFQQLFQALLVGDEAGFESQLAAVGTHINIADQSGKTILMLSVAFDK